MQFNLIARCGMWNYIMKVKVSKKAIFVIIIGILFLSFLPALTYWFLPIDIQLIEMQAFDYSDSRTGWFDMYSPGTIDGFKHKLPDIDYSKECLIISIGRPLRHLMYVRNSKNDSRFEIEETMQDRFSGIPVYYNVPEQKKIYIYKTSFIRLENQYYYDGCDPDIFLEENNKDYKRRVKD